MNGCVLKVGLAVATVVLNPEEVAPPRPCFCHPAPQMVAPLPLKEMLAFWPKRFHRQIYLRRVCLFDALLLLMVLMSSVLRV